MGGDLTPPLPSPQTIRAGQGQSPKSRYTYGTRTGTLPRGATRPNHETVQGHEGKLEGMARNCEDTNTGDGNLGC